MLEHFDATRTPLSLKQICDQGGYPPSSGAAILKSLVLLGYLEYDKRSRTYLPTMRIAALGSWVVTELFGSMNVIGLMEALRDETHQSVMLATQSDLYTQYVHVLHSRQEYNHTVPPGALRPLAESGFGHLLLSGHTDQSILSIVRRIDAARRTGVSKLDVAKLLATVNTIRQNEYALSHNLVTEGASIVGMLLPETPFRRIFAIGLAGPSRSIVKSRDKYLELLRDAVARFSAVAH